MNNPINIYFCPWVYFNLNKHFTPILWLLQSTLLVDILDLLKFEEFYKTSSIRLVCDNRAYFVAHCQLKEGFIQNP